MKIWKKKNRTELVFKLGNKLIKFAQYKLMQEQDNIKSNDKDYRLYYLFKIISYDNIYKLLDNISEQVKFEVGESIIRIIGDKTNLFTSELRTFNNNREVIISISEEYLHKLNISCINVTQLPMLVNPNSPDKNGNIYLIFMVKQVIFIILLIL